jgi:hypothetical protein
MGYPREISITALKRTRELLKESVLNITDYNEITGVGVTLVEKDFNATYTEWMVKVLYNGRTEPVWSRGSLPYFAAISGV